MRVFELWLRSELVWHTGGCVRMEFRRAFSGAPWESDVAYCRALRAGDHIYVTGTAPVDDAGGVFAPGDAYAQAKRCLEIIREALRERLG